jgi:short-subunit dehydrogenase
VTSPTKVERRPVAVLTGASAGVGRATAKLLAIRGYDVGLLSRGEAGLRAAADDVLASGGRAVAVKTDVAEWHEVRQAAHEVEARLGPVDVWINNAMLTVFGPVVSLDPVEIRHVTETTYLGQVHGALAALEVMRPRDEGTIVSVSSTLAYRSIPLQAAYCGGKAAARAFLDSLRTELLHDHSRIRVSQVVLPAVNTPQFGWSRSKMRRAPRPVAPVYPADAAARAILDAAKRAPRRRVLGSWNRLMLVLDRVAPGVLDHATARASWEGQLVDDRPTEPRSGNLEEPGDDAGGKDAGADGGFDAEDGGVLDAAFLRTTPELARTLAGAAADRLREIARLG